MKLVICSKWKQVFQLFRKESVVLTQNRRLKMKAFFKVQKSSVISGIFYSIDRKSGGLPAPLQQLA